MKKTALILAVLALLLLLVGCEKKYVPDPAVEEYLNSGLTAQKSFDKIAAASYTTDLSVQNKNGDELGRQTSRVNFDVSDKENLILTIEQTYSGTCVQANVTTQTVTLTKNDEGYLYKVITNIEDKNNERQVDAEFAVSLVTALVYTNNGAYDANGLYYGDIFMLKIYKFPPESFYVDEEEDLCVFDEKMLIIREDLGDVRLYQTTKINRLGLLIYDYEKYESVDTDNVMISEVRVDYEFVAD